jgi:hypothetical protein
MIDVTQEYEQLFSYITVLVDSHILLHHIAVNKNSFKIHFVAKL